ncbi:MAG TPA: HAD hydrolase family protein [Actinomycetes bacterium]|nr:HAD hydrolase family protein [Actinomycetes bacterium]
MSIKLLYSDLDGTMVGPGGCFVRSHDGSLTTAPAQALVDMLGCGIDLVLVSGRTRAQLQEAARIFGADGFVAEMGAIIGWEFGRRSTTLSGEAPDEFAGPLVAQLESIGLVDEFLAHYEGSITHHAPWHLGHETDVMLHGQVDVDDVDKWLMAQGYPWLTLVDNGRLPGRSLPGVAGPIHVYHLMARGLSKGRGIEVDLKRRGLTPKNAVAVGDSLSDLDMAGQVERLFLVANGAAVPSIRDAAEKLANVVICEGSVGEGWAEAARWAAMKA